MFYCLNLLKSVWSVEFALFNFSHSSSCVFWNAHNRRWSLFIDPQAVAGRVKQRIGRCNALQGMVPSLGGWDVLPWTSFWFCINGCFSHVLGDELAHLAHLRSSWLKLRHFTQEMSLMKNWPNFAQVHHFNSTLMMSTLFAWHRAAKVDPKFVDPTCAIHKLLFWYMDIIYTRYVIWLCLGKKVVQYGNIYENFHNIKVYDFKAERKFICKNIIDT